MVRIIKLNKWIIVLIIAIISISLWWFLPQKLLTIEADQVGSIEIFNGSTGKLLKVSEHNQIEEIVNNLNRVTLKKKQLYGSRSGFDFTVSIYLKSGKLYRDFTVYSNSELKYGSFLYTTQRTKINTDYFFELFN